MHLKYFLSIPPPGYNFSWVKNPAFTPPHKYSSILVYSLFKQAFKSSLESSVIKQYTVHSIPYTCTVFQSM
jgi:hypothetical protein